MQKLKVQLRNGFSDRNRIKVENTSIQFENLDDRTRTALVNMTDSIINYHFNIDARYDDNLQVILKDLLKNVYGIEVEHNVYYKTVEVINHLKETIRSDTYDAILTLIEYFAELIEDNRYDDEAYGLYNDVFEKEYVGYRFVNKRIMPITDNNEIKEIELTQEVNVEPVQNHINKAITYLSDRKTPDYENSIKESISAVEAMCSSIVGKSDSLGKTLNKLQDKGVVIHGALKTAFSQLYGWTSDANGIRHAGDIGGASSTFDEAKFMLVSCCAFINYLKSSLKD